MKRLAMCLATLMIPAASFAQDDVDANMNVFITLPSYAGCGDPAFEAIDAGTCADLVSSPSGGPGFLWVVSSREGGYPDGIGGAQFGLNHDLGGGQSWTLCTGGSEIPEPGFPDSGTGNAVTWAGGCYNPAGSAARVGFISVALDAAGSLAVTGDPRIGEAVYADCSALLYRICDRNLGGADLASGTNPICGDNCESTPVQETSWGAIKSLF